MSITQCRYSAGKKIPRAICNLVLAHILATRFLIGQVERLRQTIGGDSCQRQHPRAAARADKYGKTTVNVSFRQEIKSNTAGQNISLLLTL